MAMDDLIQNDTAAKGPPQGEPHGDGHAEPGRKNKARFRKGHQRVRKFQHKEPEPVERASAQGQADEQVDTSEFQEAGIPRQLAEMRWVCERPPASDRTHGQKVCRKWLEADWAGFMRARSRLEEAVLKARTGRDGEGAGKPDVVDVGTERAMETLERWIEDWHKENPGAL
jgi:hypothetical protein